MRFEVIRKIRQEGDIKKITIPKNCELKKGDFVGIVNVNSLFQKANSGNLELRDLEKLENKMEGTQE